MATPKPGRETPSGRWANWTPPTSDRKHAGDTRPQNLDELIEQMDRTPDGNIAMCHAQGKTAVYVSEDRQYIIEHPPHGPITRRPRDPGVPRSPSPMAHEPARPQLTIVIGANGSGKTTWAQRSKAFLPKPFYNADSIAEGLGDPNDTALQTQARRIVDQAIEDDLDHRRSFGFESTYS